MLSSSSTSSDITEEIGNDESQLEKSNCSAIIEKSSCKSLIMRIFTHGKELVLIFAFLLTTFATVQNNSPKISRPVAPNPFFTRGSLIEDYYYGHLSAAQAKVGLSELSFVFYYAPWSQESRHARAAYEHVSRFFYKEAYFAAINCWQPGSECRHQYSKITQWPILMAYQRSGFGIQYQKNLWTDASLTKFITALLNPFERLTTPDELMEMMSSRDCVIVAFLDVETYPRHYKSFQRTTLKFLERDPFNEVGFGVVLGETATEFGVTRIPAIRAYLWNETVEYEGNATWASRELLQWIHDHIQQVAIHLSPPGTKSTSIAPYVKQGPVLIVFTPRNFYFDFMDSYVMLRQLGMEYYNCKNDEWVREVAHDYLFQRRKENREDYHEFKEQCGEMMQKYQSSQKCTSSVSTVSYINVLNSSKNFESKFRKVDSFCEVDELKVPKAENCECATETCATSAHLNYAKYTYDANKQSEQYKTSMLDNSDDEMSPESINKYNFRRRCELLMQAEQKSETYFIDDPDSHPLELISGLACKFNKTFTIISMDSNNFHSFAERLGVDILEIENKTAAMIMDQENESTYLLEEAVNMNSLARFIYTYHRGGLERSLRTNSVQYQHTHFFDINQFLNEKKKDKIVRNAERDKKKCSAEENEKQRDFHVVIREINSEHFDSAVVRSNKVKNCDNFDFKCLIIFFYARPLLFYFIQPIVLFARLCHTVC